MSQKTDVRIFVLVGETGDYVVAKDRQDLHDLYANEFGGLPPATRSIAIAMNIARPRDVLVSGIVEEADRQVVVDVS
jgi:hypothetical protein